MMSVVRMVHASPRFASRISGRRWRGAPLVTGIAWNGNRNASTKTTNGQTTSRSYTVNGGSNRLDGFGQTVGGTSTNVAYAYNANGDLTSDGLRTYSYNAEGRLSAVTTGATDASPTIRYAHNALGQRVFKTEPLYPPAEGDESDPGFFQGLLNFFTKLWGPGTTDAEKLGFAFMYDEDGTLISETGTGGANSAGSTQYIYLPTANGPMPIAAVINGQLYAVHSDHLNTPRRLTDSQGQPVWQWSYSAFGDTAPTLAANRFADLSITPNPGTTGISEVTLNKRLDGQYFDKESGLHYNGFRTYCPTCGRYTQNDPTGLGGGPNRQVFVSNNPLRSSDRYGLFEFLPTPLGPLPIPLPPTPIGSPPSLDPENPYGHGVPPSLGLKIPFYTLPGAIIGACGALTDWMLSTERESDRPTGVPEHWVAAPSRDGKGTKWVDPANPKGGDYVRVRGDGTVTQVKNGRALDANGDPASGLSSPEAHFPRDQWQFRP